MRTNKVKSTRNDFAPVRGPRSHANCKDTHGVFRPGKTARDKKTGAWAQGISNRAARAASNRTGK
jgi:hypothetical protein